MGTRSECTNQYGIYNLMDQFSCFRISPHTSVVEYFFEKRFGTFLEQFFGNLGCGFVFL